MKRLLAVGMSLVVLLTGCGIRPAPQRALERMLFALVNGKISKAENYTLQGFPEEYSSRKAKKLYKVMFRSLEYVVAKTTVEEEAAEIVLTVTTIDMASLVSRASLALLDGELRGGLSEKKLYALLQERIKAGEVEFITCTVGVQMVRRDGAWLVNMEASPGFADAVTGGMRQLIGY